jgi:hypothetical protein
MNDATLTQLKILVERAVRPVRASTYYKRKWREELLAHVTAVFEEEAKAGDERAALAQTEKRFGDPAALTAQLQESAPRGESIIWFVGRFFHNLWLRSGESRVRCALRQIGWCSAFLVLDMVATCFLVIPVIFGHTAFLSNPDVVPALLIESVLFVVCSAVIIFLAHGVWHLLYERVPRSWPLIVVLLVASYAVIPVGAAVIDALDTQTNKAHRAATFHDVPAFAVTLPCVLLFGANLRWRVLNEPAARPWLRTLLVDGAWCFVACAVGFFATLAFTGDFWISLENAPGLSVLFLFWLVPIDILFSVPAVFARIRYNRAWAELPLGDEHGAMA